MNMQSLLNQILQSANNGPGRTDVGKYATGAVAGGVLGLLLGGRRGLGGKALRYGSAAALGAVAWNAYQSWQARQAASAAPAATSASAAPVAFASLPAPAQEDHSWRMLQAMLAAARADGHLDDAERERVATVLRGLNDDPLMHQRVEAELRRPVDPAEIAAGVQSEAQAAEIYLTSVVMIDETSIMERAYLDALATALKLPPALKAELEQRAPTAG